MVYFTDFILKNECCVCCIAKRPKILVHNLHETSDGEIDSQVWNVIGSTQIAAFRPAGVCHVQKEGDAFL